MVVVAAVTAMAFKMGLEEREALWKSESGRRERSSRQQYRCIKLKLSSVE